MLKAGADINTRAVSVTHDTAALIHTHAICMRGETRAHTHMLYVWEERQEKSFVDLQVGKYAENALYILRLSVEAHTMVCV